MTEPDAPTGQPHDDDGIDAPPFSRRALLLLTFGFEGGLLLLALGLGWWFEVPALGKLDSTLAGLAWGLLAGVVLLGVVYYGHRSRWRSMVSLGQTLKVVGERLFKHATMLDLAIVSILAGVCEEALFRGFLQDALSRVMDEWLALLLASIVFGLAHAITRTYAVYATLIGVFLGLLFIESGNLLAPIVTHAVFDFVALCYLAIWQRPEEWDRSS